MRCKKMCFVLVQRNRRKRNIVDTGTQNAAAVEAAEVAIKKKKRGKLLEFLQTSRYLARRVASKRGKKNKKKQKRGEQQKRRVMHEEK